MFKNVASQKLIVYAFDSTTNLPKTGDAGNITAYVSKDYGTVTVLGDTSATEMDSTNAKGYYLFDLTQAETNADTLLFSAKSSTANIVVIGSPAVVFTDPANFTSQSIDSNGRVDVIKIAGTTQTARDIGASVLLSSGTGTGQLDFTSGVVKANATQWLGGAIPTPNVTGVPLTDDKYLLGTIYATPATAGVMDVNVKNVNNISASSVTTVNANQGTTQPINFTGTGANAFAKSDVQAWVGNTPNGLRNGRIDSITVLASGTAQAGASTSITLAAGSTSTTDLFKGQLITVDTSTGAPQTRLITAYDGSTKIATVTPAWAQNPGASSTYIVHPWGYSNANLVQILGTAVSTPATAGILDVNVKNMNNIAATSITTISANQGTTQPLNFTGTAGSALVKSDMVDIAGAAVDPTAAQIGVNIVNVKGSASIGAAGYVGIDWAQIANKTSTNALTATTISTAQIVDSVSGNLGGDVLGDVVGDVQGNVNGSVASVASDVSITSNRKKGNGTTVLFTMQDSTTGADQDGLTVTVIISKDGGAFVATSNSVVEISDGWYALALTGTEMTADEIALKFTAPAALTRNIFLQTQP